jgi:N-acetylneuraminic acid mutarotase
LLEFFDRVNWKQEKLEFLDEINIRSLETLKDQGLSPPLVEVLETLYQITKTQETSVNLKMNAAEKLKLQQQEFAVELQLQRQALESTLEATSASVNQLPKIDQSYIYNYKYDTSNLYWTDLSTGQQFTKALAYTFRGDSYLCESPDGDSIYITGGGSESGQYYNDVDCINAADHSVTAKAPMITARSCHVSVYCGGLLYVIGGNNPSYLAECERYDSLEDKWESVAPLPHAARYLQAIVSHDAQRIYAFGGYSTTAGLLDLIQEFDLQHQMWKALEVKLPIKSSQIPCFTVKDQAEIYFIQGDALYSFSPVTYDIDHLKSITNIQSTHGPSTTLKGLYTTLRA